MERTLEAIFARCEVAPSGCWLWQGPLNRIGGYGGATFGLRYETGKLKPERVHRVAYELAIGPIPDGLEIDHVRARGCISCSCCNPAHLEAVTQLENIRRGRNSTKTACKRGHPLLIAGRDFYVCPRGRKTCRACHRLAVKRYSARRHQAVAS